MVGAAPSFTEAHVVRTLMVLGRGEAGRKKLVKLLGLGEGSVRTILKRLDGEGLIESSKRGHSLTGKGKTRLDAVFSRFSEPAELTTYDIATGKPKYYTVVKNAAPKIRLGLNERDTAIKAGADGALVIVKRGGRLVFPSEEAGLSSIPETMKVFEGLPLADGDVVVVCFAESGQNAMDGVVSIALGLVSLW